MRAPVDAAISPPPVAGPNVGLSVLAGDSRWITAKLEVAVWPLAQLRSTLYVPGRVFAGTVMLVWSFPRSGTNVTVPNTLDVTTAGLTLSPQVALKVTAKPASIVLGVISRIVAAEAGVVGSTTAATANATVATAITADRAISRE
jgi:hypothetical protein